MATLIKGAGPDLFTHEWMHSWYQCILGTNESLYAWMDEGFATFAENRVMKYLRLSRDSVFEQADAYRGYFQLVRSNKEEPASTHADHFNTNFAYRNASYMKGAVFLEQLGYIVGAEVRNKILLDYFNRWKFKHPDVDDFLHIAEKLGNMKLDWYKQYWINTTNTIDYAFDSLWEEGSKTKIRIKRIGLMPMPIDLQLTFKDGSRETHYVPLDLMYGAKPAEDNATRKVYAPWPWTNEMYVVESDRRLADISIAEIDPSMRLADLERRNNRLKIP
jgi:aminopeptidase N